MLQKILIKAYDIFMLGLMIGGTWITLLAVMLATNWTARFFFERF